MRGWGGTFLSVNGKERVLLQSQADSQGQGAAATLMAVSGHPLGPDGQESHGGLRLAARRPACSSDPPPMQIWNNDLTISLLHSADMRPYNWSYTQFSQFNQDDSLLLASGVFLGPHNSSSGEIAVISLDNFVLLSRVRNKPYDVFGCWLTETSLISGNLHRIGDITSCSVLWLNNAFQVRAGGPRGTDPS